MKSLSKTNEDDPRFRKMIKRDAVLLTLIIIASYVAVFLIPFIAFLGQKYGW